MRELKLATSLDLNLDLRLQDGIDLRDLEDLLASVEYLTLTSAGRVRGWAAISGAMKLKQLVAHADLSEPLDIPGLPHLERILASGSFVHLALRSPLLREAELSFEGAAWPSTAHFAGPVETLILDQAKRIEHLEFSAPAALTTLRIWQTAEFNLEILDPGVDLEWLEFSRVRRLTGIARLARMRRLRRVVLDRVRSIPDGRTVIRSLVVSDLSIDKSGLE